jgi:hypothetical protein
MQVVIREMHPLTPVLAVCFLVLFFLAVTSWLDGWDGFKGGLWSIGVAILIAVLIVVIVLVCSWLAWVLIG